MWPEREPLQEGRREPSPVAVPNRWQARAASVQRCTVQGEGGQNLIFNRLVKPLTWTGYSYSNRGSPLGQNDWSCFEAVSAVAHPIATEREDREDWDLALASTCWARPLGLGTIELQHQDKSHLHLGTAGAHSQVVALFDPGHRRYIVPRLLHLQQLQNVTSASTPQVYTVVQSHSQYIPRAPIHKVQVCQREKGRA